MPADTATRRRLIVRLHPADNVATALAPLASGTVQSLPPEGAHQSGTVRELTICDDIPFGHKVALEAIGAGESIRKYGEVIGRAAVDIPPGRHVHVHNIESQRGRGDLPTTR
jgi:altronate dehydratase small subunit